MKVYGFIFIGITLGVVGELSQRNKASKPGIYMRKK